MSLSNGVNVVRQGSPEVSKDSPRTVSFYCALAIGYSLITVRLTHLKYGRLKYEQCQITRHLIALPHHLNQIIKHHILLFNKDNLGYYCNWHGHCFN